MKRELKISLFNILISLLIYKIIDKSEIIVPARKDEEFVISAAEIKNPMNQDLKDADPPAPLQLFL